MIVSSLFHIHQFAEQDGVTGKRAGSAKASAGIQTQEQGVIIRDDEKRMQLPFNPFWSNSPLAANDLTRFGFNTPLLAAG